MERQGWRSAEEVVHLDICTIFHKEFATLSKLPPLAGVSQTCYSQADCTGDVVEAPGLTIKDCCVGTNDGQSFADSSGTCIEDQCVGKRISFPYLMFIATYNYATTVSLKPVHVCCGWLLYGIHVY